MYYEEYHYTYYYKANLGLKCILLAKFYFFYYFTLHVIAYAIKNTYVYFLLTHRVFIIFIILNEHNQRLLPIVRSTQWSPSFLSSQCVLAQTLALYDNYQNLKSPKILKSIFLS